MNKLLSAHFSRLWKSKTLLLYVAGMMLFAGVMLFNIYRGTGLYETSLQFNDLPIFVFNIFIGGVLAAFVSLFLGTEYSDGTMCNKLIVGHRRSDLYLSNLFSSFVVGLILAIVYVVVVIVGGIPVLASFEADWKMILLLLISSVLLILVYASIYTMVSMLFQNKAAVAVTTLIAFFVLLMVATQLQSRLSAEEFYTSDTLTDAGEYVQESVANPNYLRGTERAVYQFFYDFLPTSQANQIAMSNMANLVQMWIYSLAITVMTTVIGLLGFRKKDIK
ncbi:ABC transporter permease subunit [Mesobacillus zeae]|uniref:ABC transporter permease n=1 Tax=Mesobacillus zeae TaxID=1917180 RepID=A0A398B1K8_9BACI|nr:ABC transporter permease subunit [Mesobacillus zeae]RID81686.1 ABC transporter permease [Mesobacillus zeae]